MILHAIHVWIEDGKYRMSLHTFERENPLSQEIIILGTKDECTAIFNSHVPRRQAEREISIFLFGQLHESLAKLVTLADSALSIEHSLF